MITRVKVIVKPEHSILDGCVRLPPSPRQPHRLRIFRTDRLYRVFVDEDGQISVPVPGLPSIPLDDGEFEVSSWTQRKNDRTYEYTDVEFDPDNARICQTDGGYGGCRGIAVQKMTMTIDGNIPGHPERNNGVITWYLCRQHAHSKPEVESVEVQVCPSCRGIEIPYSPCGACGGRGYIEEGGP